MNGRELIDALRKSGTPARVLEHAEAAAAGPGEDVVAALGRNTAEAVEEEYAAAKAEAKRLGLPKPERRALLHPVAPATVEKARAMLAGTYALAGPPEPPPGMVVTYDYLSRQRPNEPPPVLERLRAAEGRLRALEERLDALERRKKG